MHLASCKLTMMGIAVCCLGCQGASWGSAESVPHAAAVIQPDLFGHLKDLGVKQGVGSMRTLAAGAVEVECEQRSLPCDMRLLTSLTTPENPGMPVNVKYTFQFHNWWAMRVDQLGIETNLPRVPAKLNPDPSVRRTWPPQARVMLEFEVMLSSIWDHQARPARAKMMVRSRLVKLYDDGSVASEPSQPSVSWFLPAIIWGPRGFDSGEDGRFESRWYECWPWAYTILDVPDDMPPWWPRALDRSELIGKPMLLVVAHGYYAPKLGTISSLWERVTPVWLPEPQ